MRHNLILMNVSIILTLILLEMFTRVVDPLGAYRYTSDMRTLYKADLPDSAGLTYPAGTIQFGNWSATINEDGNRSVPASHHDAPCRIALIGDSVTFGLGVNDDQTWANRVAAEFPYISFVNAGKTGYNAGNFQRAVQENSADGYIYLAIENDGEPAATDTEVDEAPELFPALEKTLAVIQWGHDDTFPANRERYERTYRQEAHDFLLMANLIVFTFDDNRLNNVLLTMRPDTITITRPPDANSITDSHPNSEGHRKIAEQMLPALRAYLPALCK